MENSAANIPFDPSWTDISVVVLVIGLFSYFFGKIILKRDYRRDYDYNVYVNGVLFLILFVAMPTIVIFEFKLVDAIPMAKGLVVLAPSLVYIIGWHQIKKKENKQKDKKKNLLRELIERHFTLCAVGLFLINTFQIITVINELKSDNEDIAWKISLIVFSLGALTTSAMIFGWSINKKTSVKIYHKKESSESFEIIKILEDYIIVKKGKKIIYLNSDKLEKFEVTE
ncbi:Uncharacterised protein [uncultured archaeon]|nr:Uncharacterised protein [uncultured archaeon]